MIEFATLLSCVYVCVGVGLPATAVTTLVVCGLHAPERMERLVRLGVLSTCWAIAWLWVTVGGFFLWAEWWML